MDAVHKKTVKRRKAILDLLEITREVYIDDLKERFGVSEVTIRKDLQAMEDSKILIRARGGAMKIQSGVGVDFRISEKHKINFHQKILIGKTATTLINPGDTIIIDSGTTTMEMANQLPKDIELTVITNAVNIANILSGHPNINVIVPGGFLRKNSLSLVGPLAEQTLHSFHVDKAFLGVDGIDVRSGFYTPNLEEAFLNRIMIEIADQTIILADSSKFQRKSLNFICGLNDISSLITDSGVTKEDLKVLSDHSVYVINAK